MVICLIRMAEASGIPADSAADLAEAGDIIIITMEGIIMEDTITDVVPCHFKLMNAHHLNY